MATDSLFTRLAPVLNMSDLAAERAFYEKLGLPVTYEGSEYPDFIPFLLRTPSGYRLALEGESE